MRLEDFKKAIQDDDIEAAKTLIGKHDYLNEIDATTGKTAFHLMAEHNAIEVLKHLIIVNALIDRGADMDKAEKDGRTPLYIACQKGHDEIVNALIGAGADMDKADDVGRTPLHLACYKRHFGVVVALIETDADKDIADNDGETPLDIARGKKHMAIVTLLEKHTPNLIENHVPNLSEDPVSKLHEKQKSNLGPVSIFSQETKDSSNDNQANPTPSPAL